MVEPQQQQQQRRTSDRSRVEIINTVQRPLGFFVLVVLVVEVVLGVVAGLSEGSDRTYLIVGMLALIFSLVMIVAAMAVWRPESLQGNRPLRSLPPSVATSEVPEVLRVSKPAVLCAASKEYDQVGFDIDIKIIQRLAVKARIVRDLTSSLLRRLLTEKEFAIVHLLNRISSGDGTLVFGSEDRMSSDGFGLSTRFSGWILASGGRAPGGCRRSRA